jgi:hypothetical protein
LIQCQQHIVYKQQQKDRFEEMHISLQLHPDKLTRTKIIINSVYIYTPFGIIFTRNNSLIRFIEQLMYIAYNIDQNYSMNIKNQLFLLKTTGDNKIANILKNQEKSQIGGSNLICELISYSEFNVFL